MAVRRCRPKHRGKLVLLLALVLMLLCVGAAAGVRQALATQEPVPRTVVVQAGDTLWDIARRFGDAKTDTRRLVHEIRVLNGLESASIHPGQVLVIPGR